MERIRLSSGCELELDRNALDNMELLDALIDADEGDHKASVRLIRLLLSPAERKKLYDHLRNEQGRVPVQEIYAAVAEIFRALNQGKNS